MKQTGLTVRPMTVMECTLDNPKYMNLGFEQARQTCTNLLDQVSKHNGEANLLWHNTQLSNHFQENSSYQKQLYLELLNSFIHR